jgi:hypothetical protein
MDKKLRMKGKSVAPLARIFNDLFLLLFNAFKNHHAYPSVFCSAFFGSIITYRAVMGIAHRG